MSRPTEIRKAELEKKLARTKAYLQRVQSRADFYAEKLVHLEFKAKPAPEENTAA